MTESGNPGISDLYLLAKIANLDILRISLWENFMPTRNVSLTVHFDEFVERSIDSGQYLNASEVVREGLRLLEQKSQEDRLKLERLREAATAGFEAIDKGRFREVRGSDIGRTVAAIGKRAAARTQRKAG